MNYRTNIYIYNIMVKIAVADVCQDITFGTPSDFAENLRFGDLQRADYEIEV